MWSLVLGSLCMANHGLKTDFEAIRAQLLRRVPWFMLAGCLTSDSISVHVLELAFTWSQALFRKVLPSSSV